MSLFCPSLHPNWELRVTGNRARIHRCMDGQPVAVLAPAEAVLVGLMDGLRTEAALHRLLNVIAGPNSAHWIGQTLDRLRPLLCDRLGRQSSIDLRQLARVASPDPHEGIRLLPGPRVLHWHVTRYCPRRCLYCYAEPVHGTHAVDASISRERLQSVFAEAASLGATFLLASGAEPLLRRDLPEVLGDASTCGLSVLLTTKHPISDRLALRFAKAGLQHLSLSIDTMSADLNQLMVGSRAFASDTIRSMKALASAGIAFSVQVVLTRLNRDSAWKVAQVAERQGARLMQVVPFRRVHAPIAEGGNADMELQGDSEADTVVEEIRVRHPGLKVEKFEEAVKHGGFHCDIGQTKLFFLPDGVVHRCYKLVGDNRLSGLDLKTCSVAEAWHDPVFAELTDPARVLYAGSSCEVCGEFSRCQTSGRCIYESWINLGSYWGPDRACAGNARTGQRVSQGGTAARRQTSYPTLIN